MAFCLGVFAHHAGCHIKGAGYVAQGFGVFFRFLHVQQLQILQPSLFQGEVPSLKVEGVEIALGAGLVASEMLHRPSGMAWGEAEDRTVVHHRFPESEAEQSHSILGLFAADGVVVQRSGDAADVGIPVGTMLATDHLLDYHCHLLVLEHMVGSLEVLFRLFEESRRPDTPQGVTKLLEALLFAALVRDHTGLVDTCKRLEVRVFKQ